MGQILCRKELIRTLVWHGNSYTYDDKPDPIQGTEYQNREASERLADIVTLSCPTDQFVAPYNPEVKIKECKPISCVDIFANITFMPPIYKYSDFDNKYRLN